MPTGIGNHIANAGDDQRQGVRVGGEWRLAVAVGVAGAMFRVVGVKGPFPLEGFAVFQFGSAIVLPPGIEPAIAFDATWRKDFAAIGDDLKLAGTEFGHDNGATAVVAEREADGSKGIVGKF